jgi:hypothetical protein
VKKPLHGAILRALEAMLRKPSARPDREDAIITVILKVLAWETEEAPTEPSEPSVEEQGQRYAARAVQRVLIGMLQDGARYELRADLNTFARPLDPSNKNGNELLRLSEQLFAELSEADGDLLRAYFAGTDYYRQETQCQRLSPGAARVRVFRILKKLRERGQRMAAGRTT